MKPFADLTATALPLPADAPVGSRWQCVRGRYCGHVFKFPFGGYLLNMVHPTDLFIRIPDAAPTELAMTHFTDLTAIDCPLGELDDDTASRLFLAGLRGENIECDGGGEWVPPSEWLWLPHIKYRLAALPAVPDFIPWGAVHQDFNFHTRDYDGSGAYYIRRPDIGETRWKLQGNKIVSSAATAGIIIGNLPWDQSLVCRPGWEGK